MTYNVQRSMRAWVGCSGWFYWHWKGLFYPEDIPTHHWFRHYTSQFRTVELNAPFYRWPKPATVRTWRRNASPRFRYSVKVNQIITHERRFRRTRELVRQFYGLADVLGSQMGCFLFQLPPSYHYSASRLRSVITQLDPAYRNVVEFRHRSWWRESVFDAFRERGLIFCSVSGPRLPEELIQTTNVVYLRFHGVKRWYRHDYTRDELLKWALAVRRSAPAEVWAYFNNDREGFALKNAWAFEKLLKQTARKSRLTESPG